ncbi:DUF4395 domain-containing protein [Alicyclobacillus cycloheptanicus]|uniref:Membrane protein YdbS with pleckstrin-like domain n=1 Tax=Alicyclobacillus cycloheptanicus TaxID=1457 RepID=A0ABT9XFY4_9BACL|nr:DUF4395 domain-containing protein [Alicyclobacillus cycloheptanicus]MDQ0189206.1 membrane protein YdbS with pleckstrin-like domain [Alicyclobacillus cycloheptanicus]WDM00391.1 DUF4395 domain-containing protein [Alicyclobacillus cycloheptanicus]
MSVPPSIPRPLVRTNQWFIVLSVAATWLTGFYWILALPLVAGLLGLFTGFNPVMRFAKLFLRKAPAAYAQEDRDQQQFNQIIAVSCLVLSMLGYALHWMWLAYIFSAMVALAAFIAILGFCIGCFIRFQWTQYRYRRAMRNEAR